MKKIYLNPTTKIVNIELAKMIAASNPEGFKKELGEGVDGNQGLTRRGSIWDDDEEE